MARDWIKVMTIRAVGLLGLCVFWAASPVMGGEAAKLSSYVDEPTEAKQPVSPGSITLGGQFSEDLSSGFADILMPVWQPGGHMFFFNPRVFGTDDELERYSVGGGWRWVLPQHEIIVGANAYWDHLDSPNGFEYEQLGVGAEVLTRWVDARFNYYLPEDDVNRTGESDFETEDLGSHRDGDFIVHEQRSKWSWSSVTEAALEGYYAEAGFLVPGLDKYAELRFFGGYYHYETAQAGTWERSFEGFKGRAELRLPPAVTLDVEYVEDEEIMGGNWTGGIRVTVPFEIGNIFRCRNPFEGIGEMFRPRQRAFAERMSEMVIRSPRVAVISDESRGESEYTTSHYEYAPETTAPPTGGGSLTLGGGSTGGASEPTGGTLQIGNGGTGTSGGTGYVVTNSFLPPDGSHLRIVEAP